MESVTRVKCCLSGGYGMIDRPYCRCLAGRSHKVANETSNGQFFRGNKITAAVMGQKMFVEMSKHVLW